MMGGRGGAGRIEPARMRLALWLPACAFVALLLGGYARLQYLDGALAERFERAHFASRELPAHRGSIFGRDGGRDAPLAMSSEVYHIALSPKTLRAGGADEARLRRQARALASALDMSVAEVLQKMRGERGFVYLKKHVPARRAQAAAALGIAGVTAEYASERFYPDGMAAAHILGYTDFNGVGRAGIEYAARDNLAATNGELRYVRAPGRGAVAELAHQPAAHGGNVYLTLDRRLQYLAYAALSRAARKHDAASAAAIVMDAQTGDIVALANYPAFNPNRILPHELAHEANRAVADVVEPGSVIKPFVAALALERGLARADEVFATADELQVGGLRVRDAHVRTDLDMAGILRDSSNVGAALLARRAGAAALEAFYRELGFGAAPALGLREEGRGRLRPHDQWGGGDFAAHAYGYGFAATLPQLLRAYSAIAADGEVVAPRLWRRAPAAARRRVMRAEVARQVRGMLEEAVADGTGRAAAVAGYRVAGKTGSTNKWGADGADLSRGRAFFAGMAPAGAPRYVAVVMVDEPKKNGRSGGEAAAPVFAEIMAGALRYAGVRPDAGREL